MNTCKFIHNTFAPTAVRDAGPQDNSRCKKFCTFIAEKCHSRIHSLPRAIWQNPWSHHRIH